MKKYTSYRLPTFIFYPMDGALVCFWGKSYKVKAINKQLSIKNFISKYYPGCKANWIHPNMINLYKNTLHLGKYFVEQEYESDRRKDES